ncbi:MAG: ribosome biogenesis GTPase Der [Ruminococcaceae bacterium]|nr:ribosome biogenesis GTPase Der [Oscillospiraceae bacterium]
MAIIAIVGRPNVGKSTFFNKLAGKRLSIVADTPGVTRDRLYYDIEWNGRKLTLVDTGGIEPKTDSDMLKLMKTQAETAIIMADVIIFMTDSRVGVTADDKDIATMLRKSGKPVILAVNKIDRVGELPPEFYEFYELSLDDPYALSALHGTGSGDILDKVVEMLPEEEEEEEDDGIIRVAIIGKPNAGKSSLTNRIVGEERVIVSPIAGTTRDAIDTPVENEYGKYVFIDTAGIRRNAKIEDEIERYSVYRASAAIERSDVCIILADAAEGITAQDERIAGLAHEAGKASIIVINKWDTVEKDNNTVNDFVKDIRKSLAYMQYAPIQFISAKTGQRVDKLYEMINNVHAEASKRIPTGVLNDVLGDATVKVQPPTDKGKRLKIYYMTQVSTNPPTFVIFCNEPELFHFSYQRYIENCLRNTFGFDGTPIKIIIRRRGEEV